MKPWLNLSAKDMKHLKEQKIRTKAEFWRLREDQARMVEKSHGGRKTVGDPCWDCYFIEKKLKQVVRLFDLKLGDRFQVSPKTKIWEVITRYSESSMLVENDNGIDRYYTRSKNRDVIKAE